MTLEQNTVTAKIVVQMDNDCELVGTPKAYITVGETEYEYGAITLDDEDASILYITPADTNGIAADLGEFAFRVPANSVANANDLTKVNTEYTGTLTVVSAD